MQAHFPLQHPGSASLVVAFHCWIEFARHRLQYQILKEIKHITIKHSEYFWKTYNVTLHSENFDELKKKQQQKGAENYIMRMWKHSMVNYTPIWKSIWFSVTSFNLMFIWFNLFCSHLVLNNNCCEKRKKKTPSTNHIHFWSAVRIQSRNSLLVNRHRYWLLCNVTWSISHSFFFRK